MKPPDFEYLRASSTAETVAALGDAAGEAKILAGGQSLVPLLNFRIASPRLIIDINRVAGLDGLDRVDGSLRIGAMTRTRRLEQDPAVHEALPLLAAAASWVGHIQIRNRGTIGGSLAHADPAAELPAICVLLDAELVAISRQGERRIRAAEFFLGPLSTDLREDELLTEIVLPTTDAAGWGFQEFAQRRGDFALAGAAALLTLADGAIRGPRVVAFGTPERPVRSPGAEDLLAGQRPSEALLDAAADAATEQALGGGEPDEDGYRHRLTRAVVRRALADAIARAGRQAQESREA